MPVQTAPAKLSESELQDAIAEFLFTHDSGYLGTVGEDVPRVSPVRYYADEDFNVYIHSRGGSKFDNLAQNDNACLLVCTEFIDDLTKIRGIQVFGQAQVAEAGDPMFEMAEEFCPWQHTDDIHLIRIKPKEIIYVDSISGTKIKQRWTS